MRSNSQKVKKKIANHSDGLIAQWSLISSWVEDVPYENDGSKDKFIYNNIRIENLKF